jgi:hypothetical protein
MASSAATCTVLRKASDRNVRTIIYPGVLASCVAVVAVLTGCSGSPSVTPSGLRSAVPSTPPSATGTARFTLTIPSASATAGHARRPAYVSSSTLSASVLINGTLPLIGIDLSAGSPNCGAVVGGRACNITVPARIGADTFALILYDGPLVAGAPTGSALSAASSFAATVAEGTSNVTAPLVLGGVPAKVDIAAPGLAGRAPATVPMIVTAYDADGNTIVGPAAYVNASGNAAPLNLSLTTATTQFVLHDGAQAATSVTIAAPTDAVTLQLTAPADVLGGVFSVSSGGSSLPPSATGSRLVAVSGTLQATQLAASISTAPDYLYFAPSDASITTGVPSGFAFSIGTQSGGVEVGYFDGATETIKSCSYGPQNNIAVTPVDNGLGFAYNGAFNVETPPSGLVYVPIASLTGGACGGTSYQTDTSGASFAHSLVYDSVTAKLYEADVDSTLREDSFSSPNFSANTLLWSSGEPDSLLTYNGQQYFILSGTNAIYAQTGSSAPVPQTAAGAGMRSLTIGPDYSVYGLDVTHKLVWKYRGTGLVSYTTSPFSGTVTSNAWNLVIGPDGNAYTDDGASVVKSVSTGGSAASVTLPAPGGNIGFLGALFDSKSGYIDAYYDDGLHAGFEYVFRISN